MASLQRSTHRRARSRCPTIRTMPPLPATTSSGCVRRALTKKMGRSRRSSSFLGRNDRKQLIDSGLSRAWALAVGLPWMIGHPANWVSNYAAKSSVYEIIDDLIRLRVKTSERYQIRGRRRRAWALALTYGLKLDGRWMMRNHGCAAHPRRIF